jgi:hypothetical protein
MLSGTVFQLRPSAPLTAVTGSSPWLLPTPRASLNELRTTKRTPSQEDGTHGRYLVSEVLSLLPTPTSMTPEGSTPSKGTAPTGSETVRLLPTPTAGEAKQARNKTSGRREGSEHHSGTTLTDVAYEWSGATTSPPSADGKPSTAPPQVGRIVGEYVVHLEQQRKQQQKERAHVTHA